MYKKPSYRSDSASAVVMPFKVIQGNWCHRFWYQSWLNISE